MKINLDSRLRGNDNTKFNFARKIILVCLFTFSVGVSLAYVSPGKPTGYVNDFAGVLDLETKNNLEQLLNNFSASTTHEISVVTIKTTGSDETIETYAEKLFKEWGIGKEKIDNGVLFLIAIDDRKTRIEVGYGLEGALTDSLSSSILRNVVTPLFKEGKYGEGIKAGTENIVKIVSGEVVDIKEKKKGVFNFFSLQDLITIIAGLFLFLGSYLAQSKSWWQGGIIGGVVGLVVGVIFLAGAMLVISVIVFVFLGLLFDYIVSKIGPGGFGGMAGGFGHGGFGGAGSGGFGGFGGGRSGGGGASGHW